MRTKQNTLLAGVAALALVACTGIAVAQQNPQGKNGTAGMSEPGAMHSQTVKPGARTGTEQHGQTGAQLGTKSGGSAALNTKGAAGDRPTLAKQDIQNPKDQNRVQKSAQDTNRNKLQPGNKSNKSAESRQQHLGANSKFEQNRSTARNERERRGHMSTAERHERGRINAPERNQRGSVSTAQRSERNGSLKGLQGNASVPMQGASVNLTPEQRTHIRETIVESRNAPRVGHVDFNLRVGTLIPRRKIHYVAVPNTLVEIDPAWRGFYYFIVRDDIVVVNPRDMRIVAVIPA